ncbi:hypothetical protein [Pedobacter sandarakinus]|uniref:hypothetical protein n=1 Tax=Pedobacter sandarakinus TaxID=353156 RepID=UPI0022455031|nr:hypothetical protein [Pedobacter sandarakinus]MCX2573999.1 hypothetical protein [Pedobacter sandarakinus]
MARQEGIIKLKGQIGDLAFYKTKDGYQARTRGGVSADRIANDPRFQRTRENGAEFGRAAKAGKLFRTAFKTLTSQLADKKISNRLSKQMLRVVQADSINERGMRMILDAETELLTGFEFNVDGIVSTNVNMPYNATIDRASGNATIEFEAFNARDLLVSPRGASHFKLSAATAVIDFEEGVFELNVAESAVLSVNDVAIAATTLSCNVTPASVKPIFSLLGVSFFQRVNGTDYLLSNGAYNGLAVVKVSGI